MSQSGVRHPGGEGAPAAGGTAVHATGAGPVLFCLHGLLGSGAQFSVLSGLADRYRVAAWDAPGYGGAPAPSGTPSVEWYAERAAEAIARGTAAGSADGDGAAGHPVHVLGTGWGGAVAMQLATARPDLVRSVIVSDSSVGCAGTSGAQDLRARADSAQAGSAQAVAAEAVAGVSPSLPPEAVSAIRAALGRGVSSAGYAAAARSLAEADLTVALRGLLMPSLVIAGEDAGAAAVQASQDISAAIPEAVFVTMHGAGRFTHLERPDTFTAWTRSFLYIVDRVAEEASA